jgi:hypothetical protein
MTCGSRSKRSVSCEVFQRAAVDPVEAHVYFGSLMRKSIGRWNQA